MRRGRVLALVAAALASGCAAPAAPEGDSAAPSSATAVVPGEYDVSGPWPRVLELGSLRPLPDEVVELRSALDGEAIQVGVVRPDVPDDVRVPVVAHASVYLSDLRGAPLRDAFPYPPESGFLVENLVARGYAVAWIPARGTAGSGGCWDAYGPATRADLSQAVTWLAEQPWSDGNVGMVGISWDAVTAWQVAAAGNPHLRTIVVAASEPDMFSFFFRNGTASTLASPGGQAGFWAASTTGTTTLVGAVRDEEARQPRPRSPAAADPCPEVAAALADSARATASGERAPFWAERDLRPLILESARAAGPGSGRGPPSVFVVHGLRDDFAWARLVYPWIHELEAEGVEVRHLLGQWGHDLPYVPGPTPRWDFAETLVRWYDAHLRGAPVDLGARVQVADSEGAWRVEAAWPPPDAALRTFWLAADGALADAPGDARGSALLVADAERAAMGAEHAPAAARPAAAALPECRGCARFATAPLEGGLRFAGLPQVPVTVTPTGPGGSVAAFLYIDGPDGPRRVSAGILDLRFAAGSEAPRAVVPGAPLVARLELEAVDVVVPDGARLVLAVGQVGYGAVLNYYRPAQPAWPVRLEVGGEQSALRVLAFERGEDAFFEAPPAPT